MIMQIEFQLLKKNLTSKPWGKESLCIITDSFKEEEWDKNSLYQDTKRNKWQRHNAQLLPSTKNERFFTK